jgi:hypothetical protein
VLHRAAFFFAFENLFRRGGRGESTIRQRLTNKARPTNVKTKVDTFELQFCQLKLTVFSDGERRCAKNENLYPVLFAVHLAK